MQKHPGLVEKFERNQRRSLHEAMSGRKPLFPMVNCNGEQVNTFVLSSIQLMATSRRVLIFADSDNTVIAAQSFNRKLDWLKIRDYLADPSEGREIIEMVIYVGLPPARERFE